MNNISSFVEFVRDSDFAVISGYLNSWAFVKKDLHSLERHTNIGLCFGEEEELEEDENNM